MTICRRRLVPGRLAIALVLAGAVAGAMTPSARGVEPLEGQASAGPIASQSERMIVSTEWLAANLGDPDVVVLATGESDEFVAGHIPGASFIGHMETLGNDHRLLEPTELATALSRAGARDDSQIVLYGDHPMSTGWLYMAFASIGHADHVSMLSGNIEAWKAEGRPVSTGAGGQKAGRLRVKPAPDVVVTAPWVRERLEAPGVRIIDARTQSEWDNGRLPGATLVLWQDLFEDVKTLRFKPRSEIRTLLAKAGVEAGHQVVTYCAIGMRASLMYFAAKYAGYDGRVYVGSWQDWSRQAGYPIIR